MSSFAALGLSASLIRWIEAEGFSEPTEIQAKAIPILLDGRDLTGTAQTGEGKTAAYLLPILERLTKDGEALEAPISRRPQVLILAPTRELASQIGDALRIFSKGMRIYYTVIFGGTRFLTQQKVMDRGVQILVATPGRLMDHHRRGTVRLDRVTTFVLDEADRMLDMGFVNEVKEIAGLIPTAHQTIMFSATMSRGVRDLAASLLHNPERLDVGRENAVAANVDHRVMRVQYRDKKPLLMHLLAQPEVSRVLVFTRTKAMADVLAKDIQEAGLAADAIHGDREQSTRQKVLKDFRDGTINILVATDVAARGIDVPDITHVINYDMPIEGDAYVHRVGRTGRAGQKGSALSIVTGSEGNLVRIVERVIGQKIPVDTNHPFHDGRPDDSRGGFDPGRGRRGPRDFAKTGDAKPYRKGPREKFAAEEQRGPRREHPAHAERPAHQGRRPEFKKDGDRPYKKDAERPFKKDGNRPFKADSDRSFKKSEKTFEKRPRRDEAHREARSDRPARVERTERPTYEPRADRPARQDRRPEFKKDENRSARKDGDRPYKKDGDRSFKKSDKPFRKEGSSFERKEGSSFKRKDGAPFKSKSDRSFSKGDRRETSERRPEGAVVRAKDGVTAFRAQDGAGPAFGKKKKPFKKRDAGSDTRAPKADVPQKTRADLPKGRSRTFTRETAGPERNAGGFKPRTRRPS